MRGVVTTLPELDRVTQTWLQSATDGGRLEGQEGMEGGIRGVGAEEGEVRHGVKITQSYKRLAVRERCNTTEENRRRQSRGRRGSDGDGEDSHSETFRPG